jgi:class 3 adenylate cyclase/tetratricopeptide (TPR) repeat protein
VEIDASAGLLASERKQVTILFADFSGFTSFTSKHDAEEVRDHMVSTWERLDGILRAHGGLVEKHIGDAVMAVFGARQSRESDPVQAVRAALAMQACLSEGVAKGKPAPLKMRIGIHTGLVVLGPLGNTGEFAATGDPVNVANRIEQNAPLGGVLISHDTRRHVYGWFNLQEMPLLSVKGKSEMIQTYQVLSARPRPLTDTLSGIEGVATRMIGRELELELLKSTFQSVMTQRDVRIVTVVGDAGIGKSCLWQQFGKWVESLPENARLFCGRASAEMERLPFSLMRDVFSSRFEIQESDPVAVARAKFERGVIDLLAGGDANATGGAAQEHVIQAHYLGQLLGLDFSNSPHLRDLLKDPEQIRARAFHYMSAFFASMTKRIEISPSGAETKAVLIILEDVHWSDEGSLDLIDYLARNCRGAPVMMVCLARPTLYERRPRWGEGLVDYKRVTLDCLSRNESCELVEIILHKAAEIPDALAELVVGGAEGNPFYIEEMIKMLIDQKVIVPGAEHWRIEPERLAATRVPATLTGVLQARLDGLTLLERGVLQRASVIGRVFWDSAVERLSNAAARRAGGGARKEGAVTKREILETLAGLRRKELIFRSDTSAFAGSVEYCFKHELLRSVTYESVLKKFRRDHHAEVASWLIDHSGERIGEFTGLVAAHFEQAGRDVEAAEWYGRAGIQARAGYAPVTAIDYLRKALALSPSELPETEASLVRRLEWHEALGDALAAQARFSEARDEYLVARSLAEMLNNVVAQARTWNGIAFLHERKGDYRASIEAAEQAKTIAERAGAAGGRELIRSLHLKGWALYRFGDAQAVLALGAETLALCTAAGDRRGLATSYKLHGVAHLQLGHYPEADRYFEKGLSICNELDDRRTASAMWSNLGESARLRGDCRSAADLYQKAINISRQTGNRESEIIYLNNLGGARLGLRDFKEAESDLRQVISLAGTSTYCALSETYNFLSEACLGQGKLSEALQAAQHALSLAQESESYLDQGGAWRALGQAAAALGKKGAEARAELIFPSTSFPEPGMCFSESLRVFKTMDAQGEQAHTLKAWAEFEREQGRIEESQKKSDEARAILQRLGMVQEEPATSSSLAPG